MLKIWNVQGVNVLDVSPLSCIYSGENLLRGNSCNLKERWHSPDSRRRQPVWTLSPLFKITAIEAEWAGLLCLSSWERRGRKSWYLQALSPGGWKWRLLSMKQIGKRMSICYWTEVIMKSRLSQVKLRHEHIVHQIENEDCQASNWGLDDFGHQIPWAYS